MTLDLDALEHRARQAIERNDLANYVVLSGEEVCELVTRIRELEGCVTGLLQGTPSPPEYKRAERLLRGDHG